MKRISNSIVYCLSALLMVVTYVAGCAPKAAPPAAQQPPVSLTVSAAASLTDAIKEANSLYTKSRPNVTITPNFGGSGALQQQIEQGAPVDLFISAAAKQMDALQAKQLLLDDTRKDLLVNKVVLVAPNENKAGITDFKDLASGKVKRVAIGDPGSVPAGMYAQEIFKKLGITDQIKPKLVLSKDVRQVLAYVERGVVDAGIVFLTDAKISTRAKVVAEATDDINSKVVYPVAVIKASKNPDAAKEYGAWLAGDEVKAVFEKHGFIVIKK